MNLIFQTFLCHFVLVFFYDIVIYNIPSKLHVTHMYHVLQLLFEHQLFLKRSKYDFGVLEVEYLGHIISNDGV
jgi:primary-amine oxidase